MQSSFIISAFRSGEIACSLKSIGDPKSRAPRAFTIGHSQKYTELPNIRVARVWLRALRPRPRRVRPPPVRSATRLLRSPASCRGFAA